DPEPPRAMAGLRLGRHGRHHMPVHPRDDGGTLPEAPEPLAPQAGGGEGGGMKHLYGPLMIFHVLVVRLFVPSRPDPLNLRTMLFTLAYFFTVFVGMGLAINEDLEFIRPHMEDEQ